MKNQFDAIVGLSFGKGSVNRCLAEVIREIRWDYPDIKVVVQGDIASNANMAFDHIIYEHRQKGKYLDSVEVLKQAKLFLEENDKRS